MNQELKIWITSATAIFLSSTSIDFILKLLLLVVSIGYTATKWYWLLKKGSNKEE